MSLFENSVKVRSKASAISYIINSMKEGDFDLNPEYQREYVWTDEERQPLLQSIFLGLPIGSVAIIEKEISSEGAYIEIVDGKQRITTIWDFYNNKFPYICHKTNKKYYFKDMNSQDQRYFKNGVVFSINLLQENISLLDKYRYFYAVNFYGMNQSDKHKRFIENKILELSY